MTTDFSQALDSLKQAIALSEQLLDSLDRLENEEVSEVDQWMTARSEHLKTLFSYPWKEAEVKQVTALFQQLDSLSETLQQRAQEVRQSLHDQRHNNQHNRKAVNAYGLAKGQYSR